MREPLLETNSGSQFNKTLDPLWKEAAENLGKKRKRKFRILRFKQPLKLVDTVFVNQENLDLVVKSAGASNQEELFDKIWNEYLVPELTKIRPNFSGMTNLWNIKEKNILSKFMHPMFSRSTPMH